VTAQAQTTKVRTNKVYTFLTNSKARIKSLRGGTRSGKTYNTLIYFVMKLLQTPPERREVLTVARQTMPALRASAMRDFFDILDALGLYNPDDHNKTSNEYTLNGHLVEFVGLQEDRRVRGRKRTRLFINEANETSLEAFRQLAFRTTEEIVIDYNPSEHFSFIYDDIETRPDCDLYVTTYLDNPFLERSIKQEIELLKDADADYWSVYGLGQIGSGSTRVFTHWKESPERPDGEKVFGLDFGYNNPAALTEITEKDHCLYWRERLYERKLTNDDLIDRLRLVEGLTSSSMILADSAEPKSIEDLQRAGFTVQPAYKIVKDTIDFVKSRPLFIHSGSTNLLREIKRYSWKTDKDGNLVDGEVVKFDDHLMDAGRYGSWYFKDHGIGIFF
jgi:phage terminase large subunit